MIAKLLFVLVVLAVASCSTDKPMTRKEQAERKIIAALRSAQNADTAYVLDTSLVEFSDFAKFVAADAPIDINIALKFHDSSVFQHSWRNSQGTNYTVYTTALPTPSLVAVVHENGTRDVIRTLKLRRVITTQN